VARFGNRKSEVADCGARAWRAPHQKQTPLVRGSHAGLDFRDRLVNSLDGALAMSAFVMFRSLQSGARFSQVHQRILHVRLIRASRLEAHGRDGDYQNQTRFQCFHFSGLARLRVVCQGR
jgi:hypothetical protein